MKEEALHIVTHLIHSFGYHSNNIKLTKVRQTNKKPCYLARIDLGSCDISGFILQKDNNEWIFNSNQSSYSITKDIFDEMVKNAEFSRKKLHRFLAKQEKINLSEKDLRSKDIAIKNARKMKGKF